MESSFSLRETFAEQDKGDRRSLLLTLEQAIAIAEATGLLSLGRHLRLKKRRLEMLPLLNIGRCRLLELPAEIREQIWIFAVTEWGSSASQIENSGLDICGAPAPLLQKVPIRMDRFNRLQPPAITRVCTLTRDETLHLYYSENVFECWRPLFWVNDWSQSTFIDWLTSLGPEQRGWLTDVVLLYKHNEELDHDINEALDELGMQLKLDVITNKQELSEYEMSYEQLGLPRHFGTKRRWDRWLAGNASNG